MLEAAACNQFMVLVKTVLIGILTLPSAGQMKPQSKFLFILSGEASHGKQGRAPTPGEESETIWRRLA